MFDLIVLFLLLMMNVWHLIFGYFLTSVNPMDVEGATKKKITRKIGKGYKS